MKRVCTCIYFYTDFPPVILNWRHLTGKHLLLYGGTLVSQWWRRCQTVNYWHLVPGARDMKHPAKGGFILHKHELSCLNANGPITLKKHRNLVITSKWSLKFIVKKDRGRGMYRLYVDSGTTKLEFKFDLWLYGLGHDN